MNEHGTVAFNRWGQKGFFSALYKHHWMPKKYKAWSDVMAMTLCIPVSSEVQVAGKLSVNMRIVRDWDWRLRWNSSTAATWDDTTGNHL